MDRPQQPYLPPYEQSQAMHNSSAYGFVAPEAGYPYGPGPAQGTGYSTGPPSNPNYPQPTKEGAYYPGMGDTSGQQPSAPNDPGYAAPGGQFQQPQFVGTTHTFVAVPVIVAPEQRLGPLSCSAACPKCGELVRTTARSSPNMLAWLSCSVIAILGCFWGCCLIPFCIEPCQDVHHSCPRCNTYLGKYSRLR